VGCVAEVAIQGRNRAPAMKNNELDLHKMSLELRVKNKHPHYPEKSFFDS
jgi:hypothetical protein